MVSFRTSCLKSSLQKELLAKAIGVKGPYRPSVIDLTAGMLGDTLLFLSFGCSVVSVERNPLISFLIESAKENAKHEALSRWRFISGDAQSILSSSLETDVIYFDPMFEDFNEKSSPRKEMRIFRHFIGQDQDAKSVFERVRGMDVKRFVVKRPRLSEKLGSEEPLAYVGKATRYDVYLSQNHGLLKPDHIK
jgi:16S rRNA (guanine1516-N2)-methyltransferase